VVIPPKKIQPDFLYILLIISEVLIRRVIMTGNTKYLLATNNESFFIIIETAGIKLAKYKKCNIIGKGLLL